MKFSISTDARSIRQTYFDFKANRLGLIYTTANGQSALGYFQTDFSGIQFLTEIPRITQLSKSFGSVVYCFTNPEGNQYHLYKKELKP